MDVFLVGGAVRDGLLGLPVKDRDWVVVGADDDQMRARGLQRVDAAFAVYRDPASGDEYALARRETKRGQGYRGFSIDAGLDVTLEEDLARRDLTINAIAKANDGTLIDPFGGCEDLELGRLRHVSPAFVEDPVRLLRIARFAAYLGRHGFRVGHATHRLLCQMVETGEVADLKAERVGQETMRAMATEQPWRYIEVLHRCGALAMLLPDLADAMGEPEAHQGQRDSAPIAALKRIAVSNDDPGLRLAVLLADVSDDADEAESMARALRVDRRGMRMLRRLVTVKPLAAAVGRGEASAMYEVLASWRGFNETEEAVLLTQSMEALTGILGLAGRMQRALAAALAVKPPENGKLSEQGRNTRDVIAALRRQAIAGALTSDS